MIQPQPTHRIIWQANWALICNAAWPFAVHALTRTAFLAAPVLLGLIERAVFDHISGNAAVAWSLWTLIALYVGVVTARIVISFADIWGATGVRQLSAELVRGNAFAGLLRRPGALPLPIAQGEVLSRYRSDVAEVSDFPTWLPEVAGEVLALIIALAVMATIDPLITLLVVIPFIIIVLLSRLLWQRFLAASEAASEAEDRAVGQLGELLGAVQAIVLAGSSAHAVAHSDWLNQARSAAYIRQRMLYEACLQLGGLISAFGMGATLIIASQRLANGSFSVGDLALFSFFLNLIATTPTLIGSFLGDYQQQGVALRRLGELLPSEPANTLVAATPPFAPDPAAPPDGSALIVRDLRYQHDGTSQLQIGELRLAAGELVVVTGRIGAGKSTLLRALIGLLPAEAALRQHRRAAYLPQVPRLFSASLRENLTLGHTATPPELATALHRAVFDDDLASLEAGLETPVGPRGVRLSGGQIQRIAAARAILRNPELLLLDDLSSALDVTTEALLWQRLLDEPWPEGRPAIIAVSHRRAALQRANRVLVLEAGRLVASGNWRDLLASSPHFQAIWRSEEQPAPADLAA